MRVQGLGLRAKAKDLGEKHFGTRGGIRLEGFGFRVHYVMENTT